MHLTREILFIILINDLPDVLNSKMYLFADDIKFAVRKGKALPLNFVNSLIIIIIIDLLYHANDTLQTCLPKIKGKRDIASISKRSQA